MLRDPARPAETQQAKTPYWRFAAMILTSMVLMYGTTYLNVYEVDHVRWSETRLFMTLTMGAVMAAVMLGFMSKMYRSRAVNLAIFAGSAVLFGLAVLLARSQATVQDESYMRAMIPHHSIAILTSERAEISDLRVRDLAARISESQRREIREMDWLLEDIAANGEARTPADASARPVPEL